MVGSKLEVGARVKLPAGGMREAIRSGGRLRFVEETLDGRPVLTAEVVMPDGEIGVSVGFGYVAPRALKSVAALLRYAHSAAPNQDEVVIVLRRSAEAASDDAGDEAPPD